MVYILVMTITIALRAEQGGYDMLYSDADAPVQRADGPFPSVEEAKAHVEAESGAVAWHDADPHSDRDIVLVAEI